MKIWKYPNQCTLIVSPLITKHPKSACCLLALSQTYPCYQLFRKVLECSSLFLQFLWRLKSPFRTGGCKNIFSGYGTAFTHEFLKEVHMLGFRSRLDDIEFARYLLKNATALNILVIDPFIRYLDGWVEKENKATRKARDEARRLLKEAPANVHLLILWSPRTSPDFGAWEGGLWPTFRFFRADLPGF